MNPKELRVVFMGTPALASYCLTMLVDNGYNIVGVITAPDKPAGRGQSLRQSEVKRYATSKKIPVLQPVNLKDPDFIQTLKSLKPDVQVVVAFRMLPEVVWKIPPLGTFNMHASLLPNYRGAAPINWVLINQEIETGVSTFFIDHKIDSGKVIFQKPIKIDGKETAGTLHDKVMIEGAIVILKTLDALSHGKVAAISQLEMETKNLVLHTAPKIFKETCKIEWSQGCMQIEALIRGLSPTPGAFTIVSAKGVKKVLKIFEANARVATHSYTAGSFVLIDDNNFGFATPDGFLVPKIVQLEGKNRMTIEEFIRGSQFLK